MAIFTPEVSGTANILQMQSTGQFDLTLTGAFTSDQTIAVVYSKTGNTVTLHTNTVLAAASNATVITGAAGQLPADLLPQNYVNLLIKGTDNSAGATLYVIIAPDGSFNISVGDTSQPFTASGNCGFSSFPVTYIAA